MDLEKRRAADRVLALALERAPEERPAYIESECGGDGELESFVLRLIALAEPAREELLEAARPLVAARHLAREIVESAATRTALPPGERIGPYRISGEIGRGGMGVVYLAERVDGHFDQTVALKLLPRGTATRGAVDRFERERQILAKLVHPHIALLLDGGVTSDGVPYFTMEYVEGTSIDQYCDERSLSLDERLRLFLVVARAVDYANSRLIVHGDVKPTNLRVTPSGDVKLLDFGIAKLVSSDEGRATRTLQHVMTPEYASPEQVLSEDIAIASDVYQLGLLLYELLTGRRAQPVSAASPAAFEEAVCRTLPRRPSATWSDAGAPRRALARSTSTSTARRRLGGDLDRIVMKALRKEPERRYRSVGQLVDDVERFQRRLPVLARSDSWSYRARKFVSRHRGAVTAAAALVALLIAYAATVTTQSRRLQRERDRTREEAIKATQVKDFLLRMLTADNPSLSGLSRPTTADLLEDMAGGIRASPSLDPLVRAELLSAMGETFRKLDRYEEARAAYSDAAALRSSHLPPGHLDLTLVPFEQGLMAWELDRHEEARRLLESVIDGRRRALGGADDLPTIRATGLLATVLYDLGDYEEAIELMREAVRRREGTPGEGLPHMPRMLANVGYMLSEHGQLAEGEASLRRAIDLTRSDRYPTSLPAGLYSNLAEILRLSGRHAEARQAIEQAVEGLARFYPPAHSHRTRALVRRLEILADGGWVEEAAAGLTELEAILVGVEGGMERHPVRLTRLRAHLAVLQDDPATAERLLRGLVGERPPPGRAARAYARDCIDLALLLSERGDPEATTWLRLAERLLRDHVLPSHPDRVLATRLIAGI